MIALSQVAFGLIWLTTAGLLIVKSPHSAAALYRLQAMAEALVAAAAALAGARPWLWLSVVLILVIKVAVIPPVVMRGLGTRRTDYGGDGAFGIGALLLIAALLSVGGFLLGRLGLPHPALMGMGFAALFVALVHASSRYQVWSMLWALLSLDTVVGAITLIWGRGLPEMADVAIDLVSLGLALVLAYLAQRIDRIMHARDIREMEDLVG